MPNIKTVRTRFRAYQLGVPGSSFSYFAGNHFTMIEGVATDISRENIIEEMDICGVDAADVLHITSWDQDHCSESGLEWILENLKPKRIEYPGYPPHTDCGKACLAMIERYQKLRAKHSVVVRVQAIDPPYISSLDAAPEFEYRDIFYHPKELKTKSNDNSTIKFFRRGSFNVLSLGDVEDIGIASMLRRCRTLCREVDIMILAHHGADNGFTSKNLLEKLNPSLAVCSSDYDNQYSHPPQPIKDLLWEHDIPLKTTKTGDVIVESIGGHTRDYRVTNYGADNSKVTSTNSYKAKKHHFLSMNADTLRNILKPGFKGLK